MQLCFIHLSDILIITKKPVPSLIHQKYNNNDNNNNNKNNRFWETENNEDQLWWEVKRNNIPGGRRSRCGKFNVNWELHRSKSKAYCQIQVDQLVYLIKVWLFSTYKYT